MKRNLFPVLSVLILSLSLPSLSHAQIGRYYSSYKELSNSLINEVYQDRNGFVWIATEDGLNKFDGMKFSAYKQTVEEGSIKNNYVHSIYNDSEGRFWIGCINGLLLYDQATDKFSEVTIMRDGKRIHPHISSIIERHNGDMWFATSGQNMIILRKGASQFEILDNLPVYIQKVYEDVLDNVWIATETEGVFRYSSGGVEYKNYKAPDKIGVNEISSFCEDTKGELYVSTIGGGLCRYDRVLDRFTPIPYKGRNDLKIKSLLVTKENILYIGTDGEGLKRYDSASGKVEDCNINIVSLDLSNVKVHSILEDRDGNLWLGIFQKGLVFLPKVQNKFDYYGYRSLDKNTIGSGCITAIFTDHTGVTWIGTDTEGLFAIDYTGGRLKHFPAGSGPNSVPNAIMCIFETHDGKLLLGSYFDGLVDVDRNNGRCVKHPEYSRVMSITEDENDNLYIGTLGSGVYKIDKQSHSRKQYKSSAEDVPIGLDILHNNWVNCIMTDSEGLVWIGTYRGLACFDPKKNTFLTYFKKNNILPDNIVSSLIEDGSKNIWIGTYEGLYHFSKSKMSISKYTTEEGMADNVICGIADDTQGCIWVSTHNGISKFSPSQNVFINYNANDGLQGNEFSRGAVYKNRDGRILFGGTNGVTAFYPWDIKEIKKKSEVMVTDFKVLNRSIKKGDKSYDIVITDKAVFETDTFHLADRDNTFSIEFSVMDFNNPERIVYQHKIKELGKAWISGSPGVNNISYSYLNPGTYTVQIRASDYDIYSDIKNLTVVIAPPWYGAWWAKAIFTLVIVLILWMLILFARTKYQHRKEAENLKRLEEINEAKLQYFMNISHEIRNPMTLIINPLEKMIKENDDPEKNKNYLMIYRNAQRILRLINQLMDIRKIDKGQMMIKCRETNIVDFIKDLMLTFEYPARQKKIKFEFIHSDESLKVWIDLNNFDKVLLNVFSNAFKYTSESGEITVRLTTGYDYKEKGPLHHYYEISVTDTGIGIDEDKIEKIFERFYQVPNSITNSYFSTGIGLHLARSLVLLHHGVIKAENRKDARGSIFTIRMPLGFEHLQVSELERIGDVVTHPIQEQAAKPEIMDIMLGSYENGDVVKSRTNYKVLLVEDEFEIRQYIKDELASEYAVSECSNGKEAMESITMSKPDLIISDVLMPEMDGITLCKKIKQNTEWNDIPVILLTAKNRAEDRQEGLDVGADSYISKPFSTPVLLSTVANILENRERLKSKFSGSQDQAGRVKKIEIKSADEEFMERIMKIINENMAEPSLSVEMIADKVGFSRVHVYRKIKEITNLSARDFIKSIKLKQAGTLLAEKDFSISDVAYAVGFTNVSHFSNTFKGYYGVTPKEYQKIRNAGAKVSGQSV